MKKNLFNLHNLLMLACVGLMIAAFFYFSGGKVLENESGGSPWFLLMILVCPLMHIFMMRGMKHDKSCDHQDEQKKDNCH